MLFYFTSLLHPGAGVPIHRPLALLMFTRLLYFTRIWLHTASTLYQSKCTPVKCRELLCQTRGLIGSKSCQRSDTPYWIGRKKCRIWPNYVYNYRLIINITCNYRSNNVHTTACSSSMCIYYLRLCFTVMHTCTYRCRTECILLKKTPNLGVHISSILWGILRHSHACIVLQVLVRI